jgi:hypothetical protein
MKIFELRRDTVDNTLEAHGVMFEDETTVVHWYRTKTTSSYQSIELAIAGRSAGMRVTQLADIDFEKLTHLVMNCIQDHCEGIGVGFTKGNHKYMWEEREKFVNMFCRKELKK